ncbi:uncharacterized protein LOC124645224 isoform X1 [Helicoverpa zea]|uniref:uncharacterized protein LOC124645224 isoform X1 n=1 Tax=Helicoverpa zea TaxID=7113 RepID=UPI001F569387|nr:uncharacterized protein LOC124645224 isoform X1 [Helicoverpa zea]
MDGTTAKVSEIFREVGTAFSTLSEITISLQHTEECPPGGKWTEEEVEMLRGCIKRFAEELNKITHHIKTRTMYHLRRLLEMDSGAIRDVSSSPPGAPPPQVQQAPEPAPPPEPPTPTLTINHYLHGFDDNNTEDDLLQSFNPGIVPPFPPEQILQPARFEPSPLFEFEDIQLDQINLDRINLLVPDLLKALDDFAMPTSAEPEPNQNVQPVSQDNRHETPMPNISTLYAEPAATETVKEVSGAFSSIRNETKGSNNSPGQCNSFHISIRPNDIKWDLNNTEAKIEAVKTSPPPNRQFTWLKPGETSAHRSSYAGQIKITELPAGHLKDLTGPSGSSRNDERPFNIFKFRQAETTPSSTFKATETKDENKVKEKFDFFKYAQAKQQEEQSNMSNFPRESKDIDKNKEESPSRNRNEDNKPSRFFNFRQPAEPRTSSGFGSLGNPSSRWMDEVSDDASTAQTFERSHSPLEIDVKATFLPIRADNKIEPFNRNKQVQPLVARRSRRLSQTTPATPTTPTTSISPTSEPTGPYDFLVPAAESIPAAARKQEQKPRSRRRKAPAAKSGEGTSAKRSRKNFSGPSAKALKNKKMPKKE